MVKSPSSHRKNEISLTRVSDVIPTTNCNERWKSNERLMAKHERSRRLGEDVSFTVAPLVTIEQTSGYYINLLSLMAAALKLGRFMLRFVVLVVLVFAVVVSANSSTSHSSASAQVGDSSSNTIAAISDHDEKIAEVLTQLQDLADVALKKLGPSAAEIDIDVVFEDSGSGDASDSIVNKLQSEEADDDDDDGNDDDDEEEDERFSDDERVVVVPRTRAPVPGLPFDGDFKAKRGDEDNGTVATAFASEESPTQVSAEPTQRQHASYISHLWPEWQQQQGRDASNDDWAALFALNGWGVDYRQFDQRQLLGPANLAVFTATTSVAMLLVLSVWSLSRKAQRRRAIERQNQWAASVELLDAMPYYV